MCFNVIILHIQVLLNSNQLDPFRDLHVWKKKKHVMVRNKYYKSHMPREEKMLQLAYLIYYEKMLQPNRLTSIKIILDHASCYFF